MRFSISQKLYFLAIPTLIMGFLVGSISWTALRGGTGDLRDASELSQQALLSRLYVSEMSDALKGYLLNPANAAEAERKKKADEMNGETIEKMKTLTKDEKFVNLIAELGKLDEEKLNPAEDKVLDLVKQGDLKKAQEVYTQEYAPIRAEYNAKSMAIADQANKISEGKENEVEAEMRRAVQIILLSLGFGSLLVLSALFAIAWQISKTLRQATNELAATGTHFQNSSESLASAGQSVSSGTAQAAASLEETVASIEELSSMVKVNSESAQAAAQLSQHSAESALKGQTEIQILSKAMNEISNSSKKIAEITGVIDDIAFQTNLLALNAAVEAARAGEQGKGFAVVAEAVRNLAQRSAVAAKDISSLIQESSSKTEQGVQVADRSAKALVEIVTSIRKVADLNSEISTASTEQSNGISQISQAMQELDRSTQNNAAAADQVAGEANEISSQANSLQDLVTSLRLFVNGRHGGPAPSSPTPSISEVKIPPKSKFKKAS